MPSRLRIAIVLILGLGSRVLYAQGGPPVITTLGETGGDALSMTLDLGYLLSTPIFMACFLVALAFQIKARTFHSFLYWTVIVTTTTVGTTMADFADRSLGVGYVGCSLILFALLMIVLTAWHYSVGSISFSDITATKVEVFYWVTICQMPRRKPASQD